MSVSDIELKILELREEFERAKRERNLSLLNELYDEIDNFIEWLREKIDELEDLQEEIEEILEGEEG